MNRQQYREALNESDEVRVARDKFDAHIDHCTQCTTGFCTKADALWRAVLITAMGAVRRAARREEGSA